MECQTKLLLVVVVRPLVHKPWCEVRESPPT